MTRASGVEAARRTLEEALHRFDPRDADSVLRTERACIEARTAAEEFFGTTGTAFDAFCDPIRERWPAIREARADLLGETTELHPHEIAGLDRWLEGRDAAQANTFIERLRHCERHGVGGWRVASCAFIEFAVERRNLYAPVFGVQDRPEECLQDHFRLRQEPEVLRAAQRYVRRWVVEQARRSANVYIPPGMLVQPSPLETRAAAQFLAELDRVTAQFVGLGVPAEQAARALQAMGGYGATRFTKEAKARARELLLSRLTGEQRKTFEDEGSFVIRSQVGNSYRVEAKSQTNVTCLTVERVLDSTARPRRFHRYCLTVPGVPLDDQLLAQKILLESDESGFHAKAIDHGPAYSVRVDPVNPFYATPAEPQTAEFHGVNMEDVEPLRRALVTGGGVVWEGGHLREAREGERAFGIIEQVAVDGPAAAPTHGGAVGHATVRLLGPPPPYIAVEMDSADHPGEFTELDAVTVLDWRDETVVECRTRDLLSVNQPVISAGDGTLRAAEEGERALGVVTAVETRPGEELHRIQVLMGPPLMQARRPLRQLIPRRREPPVPDPGPVDNWPRWLGRLRAWNADPGVQRIAGIIRGDVT